MATIPPRLGEVVAFDAECGLGTVRDAGGAELPFHCTQIADGSRTIAAGTPVVFVVAPGPLGRWEAASLVKLPTGAGT